MDALDVFWVGAEVGGVVDFVLEEDPGDAVGREVGWLDCVGGGVEEVVLETSRGDRQLEVAAGFQVRVTDGSTPEFQRVGGHRVFGGRLFVFAVEGFVEAVCPGVAVIPVEVPRYGEEVV